MFLYIVLTSIYTTSGLRSTSNMRKYYQIDVYIYHFMCTEMDYLVLFVLLLYGPNQQLWSWQDGQFT